jgi:hypothetical protein
MLEDLVSLANDAGAVEQNATDAKRDSALYDDDVARRTVIEFICVALVPQGKR